MVLYAVGKKTFAPLSHEFQTLFLDFETCEFVMFDGCVMAQLTADRKIAERWLEPGNKDISIFTFDLIKRED